MILAKVVAVHRHVSETWETLPMAEQIEWAEFFTDYLKNVLDIEDNSSLGGALAQIWALAHEYYRVYGPLWGAKAGVEEVFNPPSEKLVDETSGIEVDSQRYSDWNQGRQTGLKEARETVSTISWENDDPRIFRKKLLDAFQLLPKQE